MSKPGVRFYRGTWQEWIKDLESGKEEWLEFDGIYFGKIILLSHLSKSE